MTFATTAISRKKAICFLILAAFLWSSGGILIKSIPAHPLALAGIRSGIASLVILFFLRRPRFIWTAAQFGAAISYVATVVLFVCATKMTTAANAILLQYTAPIYVALFSAWFLNEKIRAFDWFIIAMVFVGMLLFFVDELSNSSSTGNLLAIASGVSFAWMALFMKKQGGVSVMESMLLGNVFTFVIMLPWIGQIENSVHAWTSITLLGVFQLGLPYILYALAIPRVSALEAILIPVIEPILNPLWVMLFFHERPSASALVGGAVVLISITARSVLSVRESRRAARV